MRSDRNKRRAEREKRAFNRFTRKVGLLYALITALFMGLIAYSGFFTITKYIIVLAIVAIITLMIFAPLYSCMFKKSRKGISLVLAVALSSAYVFSGIYIYETLNFFDDLAAFGKTLEEYVVVVKDDSSLDSLQELEDRRITFVDDQIGINAAIEDIRNKVPGIALTQAESYTSAALALLDGDTVAVYANQDEYANMKKDVAGFADNTKVLASLKVNRSGAVADRVDIPRESFNVLITGMDTDGDIRNLSRSDVNIVATVNPRTKTILLTSIPRDYYVKLGQTELSYDKLTHTGMYGAGETVHAVEHLLDIPINYYVRVNYSTVIMLVDTVGGIDVQSDYNFTAGHTNYHYKKGLNHLDGRQTLAFARERYSFEDGDFQRNKNQQHVIDALLKKFLNPFTLASKYDEILNVIKTTVEANFTAAELSDLVKLQTAKLGKWKVQHQSVVGEVSPNLMPCASLGGNLASVVIKDENSVEQAHEKIKEIMSNK